MISFDMIIDKLLEGDHSLLYIKQIILLLKIMINPNYFRFNNNIYYQQYGLMINDLKTSFLSEVFLEDFVFFFFFLRKHDNYRIYSIC